MGAILTIGLSVLIVRAFDSQLYDKDSISGRIVFKASKMVELASFLETQGCEESITVDKWVPYYAMAVVLEKNIGKAVI